MILVSGKVLDVAFVKFSFPGQTFGAEGRTRHVVNAGGRVYA